MKSKVIGIDLAKNVFQVCALSATNKVLMNKSVRRNRFLATLRDCEPTVVGLESCSSAHHWGRQLEQLGHEVRLIPAQHVKAFATGHKSDRRDALAIAEALQRPGIHCIRPKPIAQQDLQLLSRARERLMAQRTATANQIRGLAREYGVFFSLGYRKLLAELPEALESGDNELSALARELLDELRTELYALTARIESIQTRLNALTEHCPLTANLKTIPGFGTVVAPAFCGAVGDGAAFRNGRQLAAWLGLVPRQYATGGKTRLYGITKQGDRALRTLLIHGARAVVRWAHRRNDALGRWLLNLKARIGLNKTVVALANKLARIAWAVLASGKPFDVNKACAR